MIGVFYCDGRERRGRTFIGFHFKRGAYVEKTFEVCYGMFVGFFTSQEERKKRDDLPKFLTVRHVDGRTPPERVRCWMFHFTRRVEKMVVDVSNERGLIACTCVVTKLAYSGTPP